MVQRDITITIIPPSETSPMGITTSSYELGRTGDDGVTQLIFVRPDEFSEDKIKLNWELSFNKHVSIDIGTNNWFVVSDRYTEKTLISLGIEILDDGDNIIANSNRLTFYLTSSMPSTPSDKLEELNQYGASVRVHNIAISKEIPTVNDGDETDPDAPSVYYLNVYNNMGELISHIEVPILSEIAALMFVPPLPPNSGDGEYQLIATMENGTIVYSWELVI